MIWTHAFSANHRATTVQAKLYVGHVQLASSCTTGRAEERAQEELRLPIQLRDNAPHVQLYVQHVQERLTIVLHAVLTQLYSKTKPAFHHAHLLWWSTQDYAPTATLYASSVHCAQQIAQNATLFLLHLTFTTTHAWMTALQTITKTWSLEFAFHAKPSIWAVSFAQISQHALFVMLDLLSWIINVSALRQLDTITRMGRLCRARGIAPLVSTQLLNARPVRLSITLLISHVSTLARLLSLARIRFALIASLRVSPVPT